jgi:lipopolysaccharide biosynthesis glycosyltransferase
MHIVCATDGNYMRHCIAMLQSLRKHNPDPDLHVHLIFDNANPETLSLAVAHMRSLLPSFSLLQANSKPLDGFPVNGHATVATYFRLLLPELLPHSVNRVIFIDADTIVTDNLSPLWQMELHGHALAAVPEHRLSCKDHGHEFGSYFNAGVMLVDLDQWRQSNLLERGRRFANNNPDKMRHWDQDVLNHVFANDWLAISDRWNACPHLFGLTREYDDYDYQFTAEEKGAMANPAIVHFAGPGPVKPWNARCQHIFRSRYLEAKAETPWASIALDDVPAPAWRQALDKKVFRIKCLLRRKLFGDQ